MGDFQTKISIWKLENLKKTFSKWDFSKQKFLFGNGTYKKHGRKQDIKKQVSIVK